MIIHFGQCKMVILHKQAIWMEPLQCALREVCVLLNKADFLCPVLLYCCKKKMFQIIVHKLSFLIVPALCVYLLLSLCCIFLFFSCCCRGRCEFKEQFNASCVWTPWGWWMSSPKWKLPPKGVNTRLYTYTVSYRVGKGTIKSFMWHIFDTWSVMHAWLLQAQGKPIKLFWLYEILATLQ